MTMARIKEPFIFDNYIIDEIKKNVSNDVHRSSFLCVYMITRSLLPIYRIFIIPINVKILFTSNCMYTHLCTYPNERLPRNSHSPLRNNLAKRINGRRIYSQQKKLFGIILNELFVIYRIIKQ